MSAPTLIRHIHLPHITPFSHAQALQSSLVSQFLTHKALLSSSTSPSEPHPPPPPIPIILTFIPTPVYTTGRREHDLLTPSQISLLKQPLTPLRPSSYNPSSSPEWAEIAQTLRGGQTTFHGPGQLVIYPILDLRSTFPSWPKGINVRCYVNLLEQATINTLSTWGIPGIRTENPGVWEEGGEQKIAALGVHLRRSITSYGVGLNVSTDLRWFDRIIACGLVGKSVTSMAVLGHSKGLWRSGTPSKEAARAWKREMEEIGGEEVEMGSDGRWSTKEKSLEQLRARMKPSIVGRAWVREFARGLFGEGGEERVRKVEVRDLVDVGDEVIGPLVRRRIYADDEELRRSLG